MVPRIVPPRLCGREDFRAFLASVLTMVSTNSSSSLPTREPLKSGLGVVVVFVVGWGDSPPSPD